MSALFVFEHELNELNELGTMSIELIVCIILGILLAFSTWMAGEYWKEKEHYRCRVFELTNGEEGSNLVKVVPTPHRHQLRRDYSLHVRC